MSIKPTPYCAPSSPRQRRADTVEWSTVLLVFACYGAWAVGGLLFVCAPVVATLALSLPIALHSSLQHEALHGHPTRRARVNEALVFLPMNFFYPYRRYKLLHLRHHADHRLTDPYDDPESFYLSGKDWDRAPSFVKFVLSCNNTLPGRILLGPAISLISFLALEVSSALRMSGKLRSDWVLHIVGVVPMLLIVCLLFRMSLWAYFVAVYLAASIIAVRSFCEHQWSENPAGRSIIVESRVLGFLFLNNNLHLVHHSYPAVAWYELPTLYKASGDDWSRMNGGYVFRGYADVLRRYGWRAKEPVAHPALRLAETIWQ